MKRTEARELAFKYIYAKFFNSNDDVNLDGANLEELDFTKKILEFFAAHFEDINSKISSNLKGYTIDRLNKIDLAIITLAIIELDYMPETPKQVVINEAVELAKKYSTDKSPKFINGFLACIIK